MLAIIRWAYVINFFAEYFSVRSSILQSIVHVWYEYASQDLIYSSIVQKDVLGESNDTYWYPK